MNQHPALPYLRLSEKGKVVTAAEAVRLIRDGDGLQAVKHWGRAEASHNA